MLESTGRVEAFSDGVFAIAITLLILEIRLPETGMTGGSPALRASLAALGLLWIRLCCRDVRMDLEESAPLRERAPGSPG